MNLIMVKIFPSAKRVLSWLRNMFTGGRLCVGYTNSLFCRPQKRNNLVNVNSDAVALYYDC